MEEKEIGMELMGRGRAAEGGGKRNGRRKVRICEAEREIEKGGKVKRGKGEVGVLILIMCKP